MQTLHSGSYQGVYGIVGDYIFPGEVIPDGNGGVLAAWDLVNIHPQTIVSHMSHILGGGGISDYTMPFANNRSWCNCSVISSSHSPANYMVLGDNNVAFLTDGQDLVSFDLQTGTIKWTFQDNNDSIQLVAATNDSGVTVKITDPNTGAEDILHFNGAGGLAPAWQTPSTDDPRYYAGVTWVSAVKAYQGTKVDESSTLWPDAVPPFWRSGAAVAVGNFSQTGPNQLAIQIELQALQVLIPNYKSCSDWFKTGGDVPSYIQFLLTGNLGQPTFGHGVLDPFTVDAFTNAIPTEPPGTQLTVNDEGGYFKVNGFLGGTIEEGPRKYSGGSRRAKDLILLHEMGHGLSPKDFQADVNEVTLEPDDAKVKANNALVDKYCRSLIER
jgi:hypothetical protein